MDATTSAQQGAQTIPSDSTAAATSAPLIASAPLSVEEEVAAELLAMQDVEANYFAFARNEELGRVVPYAPRRTSGRRAHGGEYGSYWRSRTSLVDYTIVPRGDADRETVASLQEKIRRAAKGGDDAPTLTQTEQRLSHAMASFVSMAIGDALGAPMEFRAVNYNDDQPVVTELHYDTSGSFGLQPGQWTDDASMGACIADSLLRRGGFDPFDLKVRFVSWWDHGYNNAFRFQPPTSSLWGGSNRGSVGLGGNISMSFSEFERNGQVFTKVGDRNTCGNGSLMRNGALAVYYHDQEQKAIDVARLQSYLTHQGEEAAECCALLTFVSRYAIENPGMSKEQLLGSLTSPGAIDRFADLTTCASVKCMARSQIEPPGDNLDRNWQWRAVEFRYSPSRSRQQPGYVGSYCMDALSMALHCVWSTHDYRTALVKAANRCGDADSVCDITGQVAGALYGFQAIPESWMPVLTRWDNNEFAVKAYKMFTKRHLVLPPLDEAPREALMSTATVEAAAAAAPPAAAGAALGSREDSDPFSMI